MPTETRVGAIFHAFSMLADLHPLGQGLFGVALFQGVHPLRAGACESLLLEIEHAVFLLGGESRSLKLERELVHSHQVFAELGGGTAGGGTRVVELVHEAGGEGAERGHLLLLHGYALHLLKAVGHVAEDGLADLRATGHQVPELLFVELQQMAWHWLRMESCPDWECWPARGVRQRRSRPRWWHSVLVVRRPGSGRRESRHRGESRISERLHPGERDSSVST